MGVSIGTGNEKPEGRPSLKLRDVGDYADVMLAAEHERPRYVFNPNPDAERRPMLKDDGTPKTQDVLEVIVLGGKGVVSENGADRPSVRGEVVYIYVAGRDRWDKDGDKERGKGEAKSWSGAKKDHGPLVSGNVLRWKFEAEVPGQGDRDRKIRTFKLRPGKSEELSEFEGLADEIALAWQDYYKQHGKGSVTDVDDETEAPPAPATPEYDDEAPF